MKVCAVIVAAGQGSRLGSETPKAFVDLGGKPMFLHSVVTIAAHASVESLVLVVPDELRQSAENIVTAAGVQKQVACVAGGQERWQSVRNGLGHVPLHLDWVLVHDAARPFVSAAVIDAVLAAAMRYRAVITATPEVDTVRFYKGDKADKTVDRSKLVRVGTPQLFGRKELADGLALAPTLPEPPTDEALLMQKLGVDVGIAWGEQTNYKVTTPADLALARLLIASANKA
jgi:2-C-methyl-D-erythritol 4-phosphate cytidylyltransferase